MQNPKIKEFNWKDWTIVIFAIAWLGLCIPAAMFEDDDILIIIQAFLLIIFGGIILVGWFIVEPYLKHKKERGSKDDRAT